MPDFRCAAIVLAAGASRRLGQPKQLVRIGGESLLRRTARLAVEAGCTPVAVVVGFEAERMGGELAGLAIETVLNPRWHEGMGSSLRAGIGAIAKLAPATEAVLLLVCDQPRLSAEHLGTLLARHEGELAGSRKPITASVYGRNTGERNAGVPAVFARRYFDELSAIAGDRGARDLLRAHWEEVEGIPWPEGALDLDRPEDITAIEA